MTVSESLDVEAPAGAVYDLVADLPSMGRWSPECTAVDWRDGATGPAVGARFKGRNRHGWRRWSTDGIVTAAEPGRVFAFDIAFLGQPVARWTYEFADVEGGCTVTERWDDRRPGLFRTLGGVATGVADRAAHNQAGMRETLRQLKAAAEALVAETR